MPSGVGRVSHASQLRHAHGATPRVLNCYALVYLIRGEGWFRDALGNNQSIHEGQGFLLFPGVEHEYSATTAKGWEELHVFFEGTAFDSWREAGLLDPARPVFTCEPADQWARQLKQVWQAAAKPARSGAATARVPDGQRTGRHRAAPRQPGASMARSSPQTAQRNAGRSGWHRTQCAHTRHVASNLSQDLPPPARVPARPLSRTANTGASGTAPAHREHPDQTDLRGASVSATSSTSPAASST